MTPAAQAGDEFMIWFIKDIPPKSDFGLYSKQTSIYFGLEDKPFVIVPNDAGEIGTPIGDIPGLPKKSILLKHLGTWPLTIGRGLCTFI